MPSRSGKRKTKPSLPKILIVDDEPKIRELLAELLTDSFTAVFADDGQSALTIAKAESPVLLLMDIIMPGVDGMQACEMLRNDPKTRHIPIIMLSAAGNRENRITSFHHGADDFIGKPFDPEELLARIQAKLRRTKEGRVNNKKLLVSENLTVDLMKFVATINNERINLSALEFKLLCLLVKKLSRPVLRTEIIDKLWAKEHGSDRLMDAHIVALRKKIAKYRGKLQTIYGKGYTLVPEGK